MRLDLWNTLKDVVGAVSGAGRSVKLRKGLVIAQVAFSLPAAGGGGTVRAHAGQSEADQLRLSRTWTIWSRFRWIRR